MGEVLTLGNGERMNRRSRERFGAALRELVIEAGMTTPIGNPDWAALAARLGVNYETLRKSVAGERQPPEQLMAAVAAELNVSPSYFAEQRLLDARRLYDVREVGFEDAIRNLERFAEGA